MSHRFLVKEIARQAGVGTATVDRVLNGREHVREHTRQRVLGAIAELERQQFQLGAAGRKLVFDVIVEAPRRFSEAVRQALEAELPSLRPAIVRPRFIMAETMRTHQLVEALHEAQRRRSHGVLLKAPDVPKIRQAIDDLAAAGVPVVTLFTDVPESRRLAYAGLDNHTAGATAAYLIAQALAGRQGEVLVTMSDERFRGEEQRAISFAQALARRQPRLRLIDASGGHGLDDATGQRVHAALHPDAKVLGVYSMGGGNAAILRALAERGQQPLIYIAHDLDRDNLALLRAEKLTAVLHHDLRQDMRAACHQLLCHHRLLPASAVTPCSPVHVVTPANLPY